jgi:hypothetical protein
LEFVCYVRVEDSRVIDETVGKVADATAAVAKATDTGLKLAGKFGSCFKPALETVGRIVNHELSFIEAKRKARFPQRWKDFMEARGLALPDRHIPPNFLVPLLTTAILEEDDELQDTWARLLVNAGDAATSMELRTAYIEILRGMTAFNVKNLSVMAKSTLAWRGKIKVPLLETWHLPEHVVALDEGSGSGEPLPVEVEMSINNLDRLGCVAFASSTFGGRPIFAFATVTSLGLGLYKACS